MSQPAPVGAIIGDLNPLGTKTFPFFWWALGNRFVTPEGSRHLFARMGSAAEAYFFRAVALTDGAMFLEDRIQLPFADVFPQHTAARARLDFAVHSPRRLLAVEIDGREFHHKTAEQLDGDYLRERRVTAAGYSVVRFTAVETFRNPTECWRQVRAILDRSPLTLPDAAA